MAQIVEVLPQDLHLDPQNARKVYTGIKRLADDLFKRGLLENLGVRTVAGRYVVTFGNRRTKAIHLLVEQGRWPADKTVTCMIREAGDEEAAFDSLAENEQHEDVPIWHRGAKYNELAGPPHNIGQAEIAAQVGRSVAYVSKAEGIARGLHPAIIERLNRMLPEAPAQAVLVRMSQKIDLDTLEPDLAAQTRILEQSTLNKGNWNGVKKRTGTTMKKVLVKRFKSLKDNAPKIPEHAEPYFETMMNYLSGASRKLCWPKEDL
jgi:ParB/RepB/Spo0J family partition protein